MNASLILLIIWPPPPSLIISIPLVTCCSGKMTLDTSCIPDVLYCNALMYLLMRVNILKCISYILQNFYWQKPGCSENLNAVQKLVSPLLYVCISFSHKCLHQSEVPDSRFSRWWIGALSKVASPQRLSIHLAKCMMITETYHEKTKQKNNRAVFVFKLPPSFFAGEFEGARQPEL